MDPNYALIRCPNGHELQAERQHLHVALNCPVCGVTFTPASGLAPKPGGSPGAAPYPAPVDYAVSPSLQRVSYPQYTIWMLVLWVVGYAFQAINGVLAVLNPNADPANLSANMATGVVLLIAGCFGSSCILAAAIMQVMWNYRIHKDASAAKGYNSISPGLALGLTLIPVFNMIWTPIIMRKLVRFAKSSEPDEQRHDAAMKMINVSLIYIVLAILIGCGSLVMMAGPAWEYIQLAMSNPNAANSPELQRKMSEAIPAWYGLLTQGLSLIGVAIFFRAVRLFEASVYPFLGAPPR